MSDLFSQINNPFALVGFYVFLLAAILTKLLGTKNELSATSKKKYINIFILALVGTGAFLAYNAIPYKEIHTEKQKDSAEPTGKIKNNINSPIIGDVKGNITIRYDNVRNKNEE